MKVDDIIEVTLEPVEHFSLDEGDRAEVPRVCVRLQGTNGEVREHRYVFVNPHFAASSRLMVDQIARLAFIRASDAKKAKQAEIKKPVRPKLAY